jgi:hypothetical protein
MTKFTPVGIVTTCRLLDDGEVLASRIFRPVPRRSSTRVRPILIFLARVAHGQVDAGRAEPDLAHRLLALDFRLIVGTPDQVTGIGGVDNALKNKGHHA